MTLSSCFSGDRVVGGRGGAVWDNAYEQIWFVKEYQISLINLNNFFLRYQRGIKV